MSNKYEAFAYVYDQLMHDAPYGQMLEFIEGTAAAYGDSIPMQHVVDLGCGTGSLSIPLAKQGKRVTGVDISADMLAIAQAKSSDLPYGQVNWVEQDMVHLELPESVDTIISFCDSLNYVLEPERVQVLFTNVYRHLQTGGLFMFDCHTEHKMEHDFGNHLFVEDYVWQCHYEKKTSSVAHELTFFIQQEGNVYARFDESHRQRAYDRQTLIEWLEASGLECVMVRADDGKQRPAAHSKRLFFVARRND